jgi:hypothetical protein
MQQQLLTILILLVLTCKLADLVAFLLDPLNHIQVMVLNVMSIW